MTQKKSEAKKADVSVAKKQKKIQLNVGKSQVQAAEGIFMKNLEKLSSNNFHSSSIEISNVELLPSFSENANDEETVLMDKTNKLMGLNLFPDDSILETSSSDHAQRSPSPPPSPSSPPPKSPSPPVSPSSSPILSKANCFTSSTPRSGTSFISSASKLNPYSSNVKAPQVNQKVYQTTGGNKVPKIYFHICVLKREIFHALSFKALLEQQPENPRVES